jgi:hypothetical protein
MGLTPLGRQIVTYGTVDLGSRVHIDAARRTLTRARNADSEESRLRLLHEVHQHLVRATAASVVEAREYEGLTWQAIGDALRMTRQSAWEAFNGYVTQEDRIGGPKAR